jgi:hypothetical protein
MINYITLYHTLSLQIFHKVDQLDQNTSYFYISIYVSYFIMKYHHEMGNIRQRDPLSSWRKTGRA